MSGHGLGFQYLRMLLAEYQSIEAPHFFLVGHYFPSSQSSLGMGEAPEKGSANSGFRVWDLSPRSGPEVWPGSLEVRPSSIYGASRQYGDGYGCGCDAVAVILMAQ